jgi:hypothetical protein
MRQGDLELDASLGGELGGTAVERQSRWKGASAANLDLTRRDRGPEGLDRGLLGSEAHRQMSRGPAAGSGEVELGGGEETVGEARPAAKGALESVDVD